MNRFGISFGATLLAGIAYGGFFSTGYKRFEIDELNNAGELTVKILDFQAPGETYSVPYTPKDPVCAVTEEGYKKGYALLIAAFYSGAQVEFWIDDTSPTGAVRRCIKNIRVRP